MSGKRLVRSLPWPILAGDDPEAVVLDLVQPSIARGRLLGFGGKAGLDEPGWQGTRTRQHADLIGPADEYGKPRSPLIAGTPGRLFYPAACNLPAEGSDDNFHRTPRIHYVARRGGDVAAHRTRAAWERKTADRRTLSTPYVLAITDWVSPRKICEAAWRPWVFALGPPGIIWPRAGRGFNNNRGGARLVLDSVGKKAFTPPGAPRPHLS
jgi:hypothetical protein